MSLLEAGLAQLGIDCDAHEKTQLTDFVELLIKWNRVYNLTSIQGRQQIIVRHLFDSLSLVPYFEQYLGSGAFSKSKSEPKSAPKSEAKLKRQLESTSEPKPSLISSSGNNLTTKRIIDVGCGAGLPGLPLAIIFPQHEFVLLDSNMKKTRFIVQAVSDLGLKNITIESSRSQDFYPEQQFDCIISRALSSLAEIVAITLHLCVRNGLFLIMKGTNPGQELETLTDEVIVRFVERVDIPKLDAERHIVCLQAKSLQKPLC